MGFLFSRKSKEDRNAAKAMRRLAAEKAAAHAKQREADMEKRLDEWKILEEVKKDPFTAVPQIDLSVFPFENKKYVCESTMRLNCDTGQIFEESRWFYADDIAKKEVLIDIGKLEKLIDRDVLGLPNLPELKTNTSLIAALNELCSETPDNHICLFETPLTPSGKVSKYPINILFNSYGKPKSINNKYGRSTVTNGSHGMIYYLADGSIGKADVDYWNNHVHYHIDYKTVKGALVVGRVKYLDNPSENPILLYSV